MESLTIKPAEYAVSFRNLGLPILHTKVDQSGTPDQSYFYVLAGQQQIKIINPSYQDYFSHLLYSKDADLNPYCSGCEILWTQAVIGEIAVYPTRVPLYSIDQVGQTLEIIEEADVLYKTTGYNTGLYIQESEKGIQAFVISPVIIGLTISGALIFDYYRPTRTQPRPFGIAIVGRRIELPEPSIRLLKRRQL
ncbi:MAG: hypothetical protein PHS44_08015 [Candidatus Dojkabacteria bacterium]|nr:hypothetical protein [Candidatus Dojkabacteria bacterium]